MIRLGIADDHQLVLEGLQLLLRDQKDIEIISAFHNGFELMDYLAETCDLDVILLDINMPGINGIEVCKIIKKKHSHLKIIALTMIAENNLIKLMLKNGADGFLHKNAGRDEIIHAIYEVYKGNNYLSKEISDIVVFHQQNDVTNQISNSPFPKLSNREIQILAMIIEEKTTQEIAESLFISFGTVETHRRNIMIKLGAKNTAGMVRVALEYKLV